MLEKFSRAREIEIWVAEFFESGKGTKERKTLVFERNWRIDRGYRVEARYVESGRSSITQDISW